MRATSGGSGKKKPPPPKKYRGMGPAGERALTQRPPSQPRSPDNRGGERGPDSFAYRAKRIVYHEQHYAENPRKHARALRNLGLSPRQVRQVHFEKVTTRHAKLQGPSFTSRLTGSAGHLTGLGVVDKAAQDLTTAALYTPAGLYQTARHPIRTAKALPGQFAEDFRHPLRHPGYTGLDIWGLGSLGVGTAARGAAGLGALRAGESVAKAVVKKPGRIVSEAGNLKVETPASRNAIRRQVQKYRAKHASPAKIGKELERQQHFETNLAQAPAHLLESAGHKARKAGMQTALRVVAEGVPIEERIRFHRERGHASESVVERKDHALQIRRLRAARKYVEDMNGKPVIRPDAPVLGRLYGWMEGAAKQREAILHDTGQMSPEGLETRKHQPGRVIEGGKPVGETGRIEAQIRMLEGLQQARHVESRKPHVEKYSESSVGSKLGRLQAELAQARAAESRSRRGNIYVPYYKTEPKLPGTSIARPGNVIGRVRNVVSKNKAFTGESLLKGQVPENTTGLVARQTLRAVRFLQSDKFRQRVLLAAHDERQGPHDVLINDRTLKNPKLPPEVRALAGREQFTLDELSGHTTAYEDFRRQLFPMTHRNDYSALSAEERLAAQSGGKVKGYKWVDERLLRGANRPSRFPASRLGGGAARLVDSINNASKLAILYLKPAYAIPNIAGNAFLNLVQQGFAAPRNLKAAAYLSHKIGDSAAAKLDSVMGEGIARAISSEGGALRGAVNFAAGKWSNVIDLPFRRAAFIHEARNLGYKTPARLRALLEDEAHHADLLEAAQRANDAIIDYSRLNESERNIVRRVIFFYPWVKGSTLYAGHFISEHPVLAAGTAHMAQQGKERSGLGPVPSYLEGSFRVGGKLVNPASAGIFGTSANVVDAVRGVLEGHPKESARLSQFLTPAVGAAVANITRQNSLGTPYPAEAGLKDIAKDTLLQSLPQYALYKRVEQLQHPGDQSRKLFPVKGVSDALGPFAVGGVAPRSYNPKVLHQQAVQETRSNMTRDQRRTSDYKQATTDLRKAMQAVGEKRIPREVANLLNLRHERAAARDKAHSDKGHQLDAQERFAADLSVIVRHGWMDQQEQRQALKWAKTASDTEMKNVSRYLTDHYFDRDGLLSDSLKYLRDHGHEVKVPTLPR